MADQERQATEEQQTGEQEFLEISATTSAEKVPNGEDLAGEDGRVEGEFLFAIGANLAEDVEMFGEETVRDMAHRQIAVKAQSAIRRELEAGTHPNDIPEQLSDWRPDVQHTTSKDPKTSIKSNWKNLDEEDRAELMAELQSLAEG